jgi:hypothetical protein
MKAGRRNKRKKCVQAQETHRTTQNCLINHFAYWLRPLLAHLTFAVPSTEEEEQTREHTKDQMVGITLPEQTHAVTELCQYVGPVRPRRSRNTDTLQLTTCRQLSRTNPRTRYDGSYSDPPIEHTCRGGALHSQSASRLAHRARPIQSRTRHTLMLSAVNRILP